MNENTESISLKTGFLISVIAHSLFLFVLLAHSRVPNAVAENGSTSNKVQKVDVVDRITEKDKDGKGDVPPDAGVTKQPQEKRADSECPHGSYGGVGMYQNLFPDGTMKVVNAVPGYPAYEAGIRNGDLIVSPDYNSIKGEPGTQVALRVIRYDTGEMMSLTLTRSKICTEPTGE